MKKFLIFLVLTIFVPNICFATMTAEFTFNGNPTDSVREVTGTHLGDVRYGKGFLNDAVYLDGDGDYIDYGKNYNLGQNFTFNVWIKPDKESLQRKWATIFAKYETNGYGPYWFGLYYGRPDYWLSNGTGSYQEHISNTKLNPDIWYMLTYTYSYEKQQLAIYINGEYDNSFSCVPVTQNDDKVTVGRQALMFQPYKDLQYKGWIDEMRIYDETLTAENVKNLYNRYVSLSGAIIVPIENAPANQLTKISQSEILKNLVLSMKNSKKWSAGEILDEAIMISSSGKFKNKNDLIEKFIKDYEQTRVFDSNGNITQESKEKFLKNYCGIDLYNEDVGAVTGSDIGYSNIPKTAENIVPENGEYYDIDLHVKNLKIFELKDVTYMRTTPSSLSFKKGNLTVDLLGYENYNESEKSIVNAIYSWWLDSAIHLIEKSYGLNFDKTASVHQIRLSVSKLIDPANILKLQSIILDENTFASTHVYFGLESTQGWGDLLQKTLSLAIQLNEKAVGTLQQPISLSNPSGQSSTNYTYWDRIFTHEMVHATMAANINYFWKLPAYITEGLAELVVGGDDTRKAEYYILLNSTNKLRKVYYENDSGQYSGGCMLLRYFAKQVSAASNVVPDISTNETEMLKKLVGTYKGSYVANQGETGLTLTVYEENNQFKALFDFYNLPSRTNAKSGKYYMNVFYDKISGNYKLDAYQWLEQPSGYEFINLNGKLDKNILSGDSISLNGLQWRFSVTRVNDSNVISTFNKNIPSDALSYNEHHYYIYSNVCNTWEEAKKYCENLGGHLAVINDEAENDELYKYITSRGHKTAYFGLSDSAHEGNWKWLDDSVNYYNWFSGEPNGGGFENYAEFYYQFPDGRWNDGNFGYGTQNDSKTFICEWDY